MSGAGTPGSRREARRRAIEEGAFSTDEHLPLVYDELRRLAAKYLRGERAANSLQPTALLHEAYLRLADLRDVAWRDDVHFFGTASRIMRRVLVDHARRRAARKRGGELGRISLSDSLAVTRRPEIDLLALDEALTTLASLNARHARIVELRFFAGLTVDEVGELLEVSPSTVATEWRTARAWLNRSLQASESSH